MARDSMQPWLDRLSDAELDATGASPRSDFGWREWDGQDSAAGSRSHGYSSNQDNPAMQVNPALQVQSDPSEEDMFDDEFDFTVASY
ncbi:hypothetical protein HPC49_44390 [Pyxidicoccus fallax]|uniref:Uncharacterized protein n=1 Tax=Pyxidicoccus fallax TaxID=394095 RepID=A0A848LJ04_9BACT|nr:hypothetical protein [Pyxidicoccus fallax]NMO17717.1 hypothetical protein [Pyxidicoccus fallax]NPC85223.1 hypothetical protein [Pyxidicoccus fallax]